MVVLFFCTGNTCRSPLAEAVAVDALKSIDIACLSAGTHACDKQSASAGSLQAGLRKRFDLSGHQSQMLTAELIESVDWVIAVTKSHLWTFRQQFPQYSGMCGVLGLPGKQIIKMADMAGNDDISDPWQGSVESYDKMADKVIRQTVGWAEYFKQEMS
jgi:protein-tyrosine-phosphatase